MRATSPAEMHSRFAEAFNTGDCEALLALYEPEATYVAGPEQLATGTAQLSAAFQQLLALKGHLALETRFISQSGDLALLVGDWSLTGAGGDGKAMVLHGHSVQVARRQADGSWRYVIDIPSGEQILR
jgi:uncharacterized protein (TIGR02246 family)